MSNHSVCSARRSALQFSDKGILSVAETINFKSRSFRLPNFSYVRAPKGSGDRWIEFYMRVHTMASARAQQQRLCLRVWETAPKWGKDLYLGLGWKLLTSAGVSLRAACTLSWEPLCTPFVRCEKGRVRRARTKRHSKKPIQNDFAFSLSAAPCSAAPTTNLRLNCVRLAERAFQLRNPLDSISLSAFDDNYMEARGVMQRRRASTTRKTIMHKRSFN